MLELHFLTALGLGKVRQAISGSAIFLSLTLQALPDAMHVCYHDKLEACARIRAWVQSSLLASGW